MFYEMNRIYTEEILSDFWWLSPEERCKYVYVDLFHQEPYSDEPGTDSDPKSCPMAKEGRFTFDCIGQRRTKHKNINIFRSHAFYDSNGETIVGPLLLDIDRTDDTNNGYIPNIDKALEDVRLLVKTCCSNLGAKDYRIFFTGHKGFHLEINPKSLSILQNGNTLSNFEHVRRKVNKKLGNSFADVYHCHIRLHNSINSWIDYQGSKTFSKSFEIAATDLCLVTAKELCSKGKELACKELGL